MKQNKNKFSKNKKILFILLIIITIVVLFFTGYKIYVKYMIRENEKEAIVETKPKDKLEDYNYYLNRNATPYEEQLFEELKEILSKEEINEEEYAKALTKLFISDLFTLDNKKSSSDITSSQYIYTDYQDIYENEVKNTIYSSIELTLDEKRNQILPIVKNVEITSIERKSFSLKEEVLDNDAYYITTNITYEQDLNYPTTYNLVMIKNDKLLQIVKTEE